MVGIKSKI